MTTRTTNIRTSPERAAQMTALARARNTTLNELIAEYIGQQIEAGHLPADLPGFNVERDGNVVTIDAGKFVTTLTASDASKVAETLRVLATPGKTKINPKLDLDGITVTRKGQGLKLVDPVTEAERTMTRDIARDLAAWITRVA